MSERNAAILSAYTVDVIVRKDGRETRYEGEFVKSLLRRVAELEARLRKVDAATYGAFGEAPSETEEAKL